MNLSKYSLDLEGTAKMLKGCQSSLDIMAIDKCQIFGATTRRCEERLKRPDITFSATDLGAPENREDMLYFISLPSTGRVLVRLSLIPSAWDLGPDMLD